MSDEQDINEGLDGGEDSFDAAGGGGEGGTFSKLIIKILTWVAAVIGAILFIVTVVVVTVSYLERGSQSQSFAAVSEEYQGKEKMLTYYSNIEEIRARSNDPDPKTILVEIQLGYDYEKLGESFRTELGKRTPELTDLIRSYFGSKSSAELGPQHEEELKSELKERINAVLRRGKIQKIVILQFQVIGI